jgi:hypothetical protein
MQKAFSLVEQLDSTATPGLADLRVRAVTLAMWIIIDR